MDSEKEEKWVAAAKDSYPVNFVEGLSEESLLAVISQQSNWQLGFK